MNAFAAGGFELLRDNSRIVGDSETMPNRAVGLAAAASKEHPEKARATAFWVWGQTSKPILQNIWSTESRKWVCKLRRKAAFSQLNHKVGPRFSEWNW